MVYAAEIRCESNDIFKVTIQDMQKVWYVVAIILVVAVGAWVVSTQPKSTQQNQQPVTTPTETIAMPKKTYTSPPVMTIDPSKSYTATMVTTKGTMKFTLFAKETPVTVNNFVFLATNGFYDNTTFHRIIKGFMIQGGDPNGDGTGGPGYKFDDEPITRDYTRGTLAMANSGPNTNGSQFFVMHADNALPKNYVIFGTIEATDSASLATLDAIADTPVTTSASGENSKPTESVIVKSVTIN